MAQFHQPTKKQVREFMELRRKSPNPPSMEEVRRHLGWDLIKMALSSKRLLQM